MDEMEFTVATSTPRAPLPWKMCTKEVDEHMDLFTHHMPDANSTKKGIALFCLA